ncbi:MAG: isoprenylcysteine carboxylmethyltransferase family protein [Chloroflexota bacterium]
MTTENAKRTAAIPWRALVGFAIYVLLNPALLFISAGTFRWTMAWVYTGIVIVLTVASRLALFRWNPDLAGERAAYRTAEGVKSWDRILSPLVGIYGNLALLIAAGLNKRFGWLPEIPLQISWIALVLALFGFAIGTWALIENRFFSAVVRIQTDRGHTVCSSGPYQFVRHPGYLGSVIFSLATPFILGTFWALIPAIIMVVIIMIRTALEDKTLKAELDGYRAYAEQTRHRLFPGLW